MEKHSLTTILTSISVFALTSFSLGQEKPAPLKIDDLVAQALANNPEIRFYAGEIFAAKAGRRIAGRPKNPELDLGIGQKRSSEGRFSAEGLAYSVSLAQPIEWPGRIGLRKSIANGDVRLAELGLERFKTFLAGSVHSLAYRLSVLQTKATIAGEVSERFTAVKEVLVQREAGGVTPLLEIRAIDAASVIMEKEALEAAIEMQKALLKLNQLMGRRADAPLVVARVEFDFPELPSIGNLLASTLQNSYDMHIRRAELAQQGLKVSLAENERYPTLKIGPHFSREEAGGRETEFGIGLSLQLPIFRNGSANIDRAQARRMQATATMYATARDLERRVADAVLIYNNSQKRLATWSQERTESFREAAELSDRHYRLGAIPVSTYIELQESYIEALEAINEVKAGALDAALEIEQLTGATQTILKSATDSKQNNN